MGSRPHFLIQSGGWFSRGGTAHVTGCSDQGWPGKKEGENKIRFARAVGWKGGIVESRR